MKHGFVRVGVGIPEIRVADTRHNVEEIEKLILKAQAQNIEIFLTPELCITGYTCQDLFFQQTLLEEAEVALMKLMDFTRSMDMILVVGMPVACNAKILDCAVVLQKGKIQGIVAKTYLNNHGEYAEKRWFTPLLDIDSTSVWLCGDLVEIKRHQVFNSRSCSFGIEIGTDLWVTTPPSASLSMLGAEIILNLSADTCLAGKNAYLHDLVCQQSARCICGYAYAGAGFGESTTDMVFSGKAMICENGTVLTENRPLAIESQLIFSEIDVEAIRADRRANNTFADASKALCTKECKYIDTDMMMMHDFELTRPISPTPFIPAGEAELAKHAEEIFNIQTLGLAKRIKHTGCKTVVLGISGGLDSTLALLVVVATYDLLKLNRKDIIGITMPGFGTTDRTYINALTLMQQLGITVREINIKEACTQHFLDIGHDITKHDVTYENSQARERTQILMDVANQLGGMVIGTGDLSELALGWATYNGDHMSMYCVNGSVPKTLVRHIVEWYAHVQTGNAISTTLHDVIDTPISPELIPAHENGEIKQKTEDLVGPYELHDFFLYHVLRHGFRPRKIYLLARQAFIPAQYSDETIKKWLTTFFRRFFNQQFKRSCLPDGPMVGSLGLSPRYGWRMPSDASSTIWLKECESL